MHTTSFPSCHSNSSSPGTSCPLLLCPHPPPHPPQPASPLRKYSSGVPRAAQEMLCTLRVSQAIFCPRAGGRSGPEQSVTTQSAVFCLFLWGFLSASTSCSQYFSISQCLVLSLYFSFSPQGLFDPMPFATSHSTTACPRTLQNSVRCHLFQKAFPDPSCPIWMPFPFVPRAPRRMLSEQWAVW